MQTAQRTACTIHACTIHANYACVAATGEDWQCRGANPFAMVLSVGTAVNINCKNITYYTICIRSR